MLKSLNIKDIWRKTMKKIQIDNFFTRSKQLLELNSEDIAQQLLIELFKLSSKEIRDELGNKNIYEFEREDFQNLFQDVVKQIQKNRLYNYFLKKGIEKRKYSYI